MSNYGLTTKEKEDFYTTGFFIRRGLFQQEEIGDIAHAFDALQKEAAHFTETTIHNNSQFVVQGDRIDRIVWVCGCEPSLKLFSHDPRITLPVAQLMETPELTQLICQAHYKIPGDNVMFDWHQDSQHRYYGTDEWTDVNQKGSFVQTLVAVDPTPIESGPLYFIPDTVKHGHLALDKPGNIEKYVDESMAVPAILEPGDVAYFHPYVIHGSQPNRSKNPRRVFINGFAYPGANRHSYPGCGTGENISVPLQGDISAHGLRG